MYFNEQFGVSAIAMQKLGVFNAEIDVDNKMFVDPKLLEAGKHEFNGAHEELIHYFSKIVQLVKLIKTRTDSDMAWTAAWKRMRFKETSNTALGFSKEGTDGNGIGKVLAQRIVTRASEILPHVDFAPDVFELMGIFAEGVGCDRLSDMIVSILVSRFLTYTDRTTKELGIKRTIEIPYDGRKYICPQFKKNEKPMIVVPQALLKPLPIVLCLTLNSLPSALVNRRRLFAMLAGNPAADFVNPPFSVRVGHSMHFFLSHFGSPFYRK